MGPLLEPAYTPSDMCQRVKLQAPCPMPYKKREMYCNSKTVGQLFWKQIAGPGYVCTLVSFYVILCLLHQ